MSAVRINKNTDFYKKFDGQIIIDDNAYLNCFGIISGKVQVDGKFIIYGIANGNIVNNGSVEIHGIFTGTITGKGKTVFHPNSIVNKKRY